MCYGAIRAVVDVLVEQLFGSAATDYPDIRVKLVKEYPYKIFYPVRDEVVEIIHVRHPSRRPW